MGLSLCKRNVDLACLRDQEDEYKNNINITHVLPTLDFPQKIDHRFELARRYSGYTLASSKSLVKKLASSGENDSPRSSDTRPIEAPEIKVNNLNISNDKDNEKYPKQIKIFENDEENKKEPARETAKEIKENVKNPFEEDKEISSSKELLRVASMRSDAGTGCPVRSLPSFAFDCSYLVKENKDSLFQKYKVLDTLGKGTYGTVKKVVHNTTNKVYAMKMINRNCYTTDVNIVNEIEVLKKIDHPNIVRIYEFAQDKEYFYLVTEYCEGGELLNKIIKQKFITERVAAKVIKQVLSAVVYCHEKNIVHRDLKLDNIVLESDDIEGNIKVIDFGTSRIFKARERLREIMGTVFF